MTQRLSLIAGSGALVFEVAAAARSRGYELQILSVGGVEGLESIRIDLLDPGRLVAAIREYRSTLVTMAGGVYLSDLMRERLSHFFGAPESMTIGDTLLSVLLARLGDMTGARLVGVHEIEPSLLAPQGLIGGPPPTGDWRTDGTFALRVARQAGSLDLGQAVVVAGRRVVAVEDISGTDALLQRVQGHRQLGLVGDGRSTLVLAKAAKPGQPEYIDLPAIGPVTIAGAKRAGVQLIAVQAGATILVERQKLAAAADAAELPVVGLAAGD